MAVINITFLFKISSSRYATFPSITICPDYLKAYKSEVLEKYGVTINDFRKKFIFPKIPNSNISLTQFFDQATHG